jgi:hypothetical protein
MAVFMVETCIVKPDKLGENLEWMKKHPEVFKEVKSSKIFTHVLGGNWGGYVFMTEFENMADLDKQVNKLMKSDFMTTLYPEWATLIVPGSYSINLWNSVE